MAIEVHGIDDIFELFLWWQWKDEDFPKLRLTEKKVLEIKDRQIKESIKFCKEYYIPLNDKYKYLN